MERLTKRITQYTIELSASANPIQYNGSSQRVHIKHPFWNVFDRLCKYEDAEENGMLIHLPCRVGDRTYQVLRRYEVTKRGCTCCTTACGSNTDCEYFDKEKEKCLNLTAKDEIQIVSRGFKLEDYFDFGKTVFLTREEAEKALKQMGE